MQSDYEETSVNLFEHLPPVPENMGVVRQARDQAISRMKSDGWRLIGESNGMGTFKRHKR